MQFHKCHPFRAEKSQWPSLFLTQEREDQNKQKDCVCFIKMKQIFRNRFKMNGFCVSWYLHFQRFAV